MRETTVTPAEAGYKHQQQLDDMWTLIENNYDEDWRVEANGALTLTVDYEMMSRVLSDHPQIVLEAFKAKEDHNPEYQKWEWVNFPEHLLGTYVITGVYDANQRFINHARRYYFVQEGF